MTGKRKYRCVIYTRKSTTDGLEQDFNSLDAQREACEAFIASQKSEGWILSSKAYDDGGISGGHMERPGLKELMVDIDAGRVDVVVVYKVDRLTRSLTDFARLVDLFDQHDVSFVSVTQQFNTTSSMGRLTLNVLLSFAQFEREVTAERIRDKIAASKRKGKWMGGITPLGYDNIDKKLIINAKEAETVKMLFQLYLQHGTVSKVKSEADRIGLITKVRSHNNLKMRGGLPFSHGHLYQLLTNPVYVGDIKHGKKVYPGEHDQIIDQECWDAVWAKLQENAVTRQSLTNQKSNHLLTGLMYDANGDKLSPTACNKLGKIYRYYTSHRLMRTKRQDPDGWRLPADHIENIVIRKLTLFFKDQTLFMDKMGGCATGPSSIMHLLDQANLFADQLLSLPTIDKRSMLQSIIERIDFGTGNMLIALDRQQVMIGLELNAEHGVQLSNADAKTIQLDFPIQLKRRGVETRMIVGGDTEVANHDPKLVQVISQAHVWSQQLICGTVKSVRDIAIKEKLEAGEVSRILPLAFLAPDIVSTILNGNQPVDLTTDHLKRHASKLPASWQQQKQVLGFTA